jgi:2-dehydro-3-deoxy-D-arabinonate dehydratase
MRTSQPLAIDSMKLFRTRSSIVVHHQDRYFLLENATWDELLNREDLAATLLREVESIPAVAMSEEVLERELLPPVGQQEVWAAGVTYFRSRTARIEESRAAGGGSFYDRVYEASRPELFLKSTAGRVIGHRGEIRIRRDSAWNVPEPELALVINARAAIIGYTIGNDVSSRDIEGENPLYLPQAKVYDRCLGLGPSIVTADEVPDPLNLEVRLRIIRAGEVAFEGGTSTGQLNRTLAELCEYLGRCNSHPAGAILLTGTGIVPPDAFTLAPHDTVVIRIEGIGELTNIVTTVPASRVT